VCRIADPNKSLIFGSDSLTLLGARLKNNLRKKIKKGQDFLCLPVILNLLKLRGDACRCNCTFPKACVRTAGSKWPLKLQRFPQLQKGQERGGESDGQAFLSLFIFPVCVRHRVIPLPASLVPGFRLKRTNGHNPIWSVVPAHKLLIQAEVAFPQALQTGASMILGFSSKYK